MSASSTRTVVIAVDNSEHSEYAFDFYVENVHKEGDRIVLVNVPEFGDLLKTPTIQTDPNIVQDLLKECEENTKSLVDKFSNKMKAKQLLGDVKQQCGKAGEAIIEVTKSEGASLLVLGSRGMGCIRRTFLGSVSNYCVHHSNVPVIVLSTGICSKRTCILSSVETEMVEYLAKRKEDKKRQNDTV